MAFWIRYTDGNSQVVEKRLQPGPTDVEYPERRNMTIEASEDGATVIQRPLRDTRSRKWVWENGTPRMPAYEAQWQLLLTLEARARLRAGLPVLVGVWEDTFPEAGFARRQQDGSRLYTTVKLLRVDRQPKKGGGFLAFPESTVEFVVDDTTFSSY